MATHTRVAEKVPVNIRHTMKSRVNFTCTECFQEVEGWTYEVGFGVMNKREICGVCWAAPRVPPMRPVGDQVILR